MFSNQFLTTGTKNWSQLLSVNKTIWTIHNEQQLVANTSPLFKFIVFYFL